MRLLTVHMLCSFGVLQRTVAIAAVVHYVCYTPSISSHRPEYDALHPPVATI